MTAQGITYKYTLEFYREMHNRSKIYKPKEVPELHISTLGDQKVRLFHGKLKDIAESIGLTNTQTYSVTGILYRIESVTRLAASNPHNDGWWMLNFEPTMQNLVDYGDEQRRKSRRIAPSRIDVVLSELSEIRARVAHLESILNVDRTDV
jgi:hypothetical protein